MSSKVASNAESANTEALLLEEVLGGAPESLQSQHFCQLLNIYLITLFYVCLCLKTPYVIYISDK